MATRRLPSSSLPLLLLLAAGSLAVAAAAAGALGGNSPEADTDPNMVPRSGRSLQQLPQPDPNPQPQPQPGTTTQPAPNGQNPQAQPDQLLPSGGGSRMMLVNLQDSMCILLPSLAYLLV